MTTIDTLLTWANERGYQRGIADGLDGFYNEAPLSGEWAGESPQELLGDLFRKAYYCQPASDADDFDIDKFSFMHQEIMDSYEEGYERGNAHAETV